MSLKSGQIVSGFEVTALLGSGGMGEVYLARDLKLGREVALKVLPAIFAENPQRLARFEREAKVLASVNHPNIASIFGVEQWENTRILVLEMVPGHELGQLLASGPLSLPDTLEYFKQIALGLHAAHERGIIHRDLKPANIKIKPEGRVKILDFGIAKALREDPAAEHGGSTLAFSSDGATGDGIMIGTLSYMSPEQARGRPVNKRSDVWSFGCLMYEALTGRTPFDKATDTDTLAAILEREPDWSALPASTPEPLSTLMRRCLAKDPHSRIHDIADARLEIEDVMGGPRASAPVAATITHERPRPSRWWWALTVLFGAIALLAVFHSRTKAPEAIVMPVRKFTIDLPEEEPLWLWSWRPTPVIEASRDAQTLVYVADQGISTQLFYRRMDSLEAIPLENTEDARNPFFSPDGKWVAFFAGSALKKISLESGEVVELGLASSEGTGGDWTDTGEIYFTPEPSGGIFKISQDGSLAEEVTKINAAEDERAHLWPEVLPGGKGLLYTSWTGRSVEEARVVLLNMETGERTILYIGGSNAHYSPTGHVVFGDLGKLVVLPFDANTLNAVGDALPIFEGVRTEATGAAQFNLCHDGTLIYVPGGPALGDSTLHWVDVGGWEDQLPAPPRNYQGPRLSPNGRHIAVGIDSAGNFDIWTYNLRRGTLTRLTVEGNNFAPVWTPDGNRIAFVSDRSGDSDLFWKPADDSGPAELLWSSEYSVLPTSFSPDGRFLAYYERNPESQLDLWVLPLEKDEKGERVPKLFLRTDGNERKPMFSPDGKWIAYESDEPSRREIFVRPFPGPGPQVQVSNEGGREPVWSPHSSDIFFRHGDSMMTVSFATEGGFTPGEPHELFEGEYEVGSISPNYDVTAEGDRLIMIRTSEDARPDPTKINVVLNWAAGLGAGAEVGRKR